MSNEITNKSNFISLIGTDPITIHGDLGTIKPPAQSTSGRDGVGGYIGSLDGAT
jgi:hypothetical protein